MVVGSLPTFHDGALGLDQVVRNRLVIILFMAMGVGMDNRFGQPFYFVEQLVAYLLGDGVRFDESHFSFNFYIHGYMERMTDPAGAYIIDTLYTGDCGCDGVDGRNDVRVNGVEKTLHDAACCGVDDGQYDHCNHQTRDRVGDAQSKGDSDQPKKSCQRGQSIDARMLPIGNKWNAIDTFPNVDFILRQYLVPGYTHQCSRHA